MSPMPYNIPALVKEISTTSKRLGKDNGEARRKCLNAARSLTFALETPIESILRTAWAEQGHHAALRIGVDLNVFEKLDERNGAPKSSKELAKMTGADPHLIARLFKHLAAMGSVHETGLNEYVSTPFSRALKEPIYRNAYPAMFINFFALPEHISKCQYKNPQNSVEEAFQDSHDIKDRYFAWMSQRSECLLQLENDVAGSHTGLSRWIDPGFYPIDTIFVDDAIPQDLSFFLVDIGGGKGHDLQQLHRKYPKMPGKLVLQDLKGVIKEAEASDLDKEILTMEYDFFTPQRIKGSRAYYMHAVLHDWSDSKVKEILMNLRPAMVKGYSKLLINEIVMPDRGAHGLSTALDMVMMANFLARERTEKDWCTLLASAGYKVVKIWTLEPGTESLIEADLI